MMIESTLSPGESVFTTAASIAPVPDAVMKYTSLAVIITVFRFAVIRSSISAYRGPRWLIICDPAISSTSSGNGTGPGIRRLG